jgi:hypothetical protein
MFTANGTFTVVLSSGTIATPSTTIAWLKVGGVWKQATVFIKVAGVWKTATPKIKAGGTWK